MPFQRRHIVRVNVITKIFSNEIFVDRFEFHVTRRGEGKTVEERENSVQGMFTSHLNFRCRNLDWSAMKIDRSPTAMADLSDRSTSVDEQYRWETFYHCLVNPDERQRTRPFGRNSLLLKRRLVQRTVPSSSESHHHLFAFDRGMCVHVIEHCSDHYSQVYWNCHLNETNRFETVCSGVQRGVLPVSFFAQALLNSATSFGWT